MAVQIRHCIKQSQAEHLCLLIERWADARVGLNSAQSFVSDSSDGLFEVEQAKNDCDAAYNRLLQMIISITEKE